MKHLKKLQMIVALLMAINIVSVGYSAWAIILPPTESTASGSFDSYPVIKSDEYLMLDTPEIPEYFNYDPDSTNTDEEGKPDLSDVVGKFMSTDTSEENKGYLKVDNSAAILLPFELGESYQGTDDPMFEGGNMKLEITISSPNPDEFNLFFNSTYKDEDQKDQDQLTVEAKVSIGFNNTTSVNYSIPTVDKYEDSLVISVELYEIPKVKGSGMTIALNLTANAPFAEALVGTTPKQIDLIFSTVVKPVVNTED